jgi:hypothetical protein
VSRLVRLLASSITLATSAIAAGYALSGIWVGLLLAILWLLFWAISLVRQFSAGGAGVGSTALFGYVILTIHAVATSVWPGWLILGLVAALAAWDIEFFIQRMRDVQDDRLVESMISQHVRRLAMTMVAGLSLAGATVFIHYNLTFGIALGIGLLAVFAISRFINSLRQARP